MAQYKLHFALFVGLFCLFTQSIFSQDTTYTEANLYDSFTDELDDQDIPEQDSIASDFYRTFEAMNMAEKERILTILNYIDHRRISNKTIDQLAVQSEKGDTITYNKTIFYTFSESVIKLNNKSRTMLNDWLSMSVYLSKEPGTTVTDFSNFIERTNTILDGYLRKNKLVSWRTGSSSIGFKYSEHSNSFVIKIGKGNLSCTYADKDTFTIYNTSGKYNPLTTKFSGFGGYATWEEYENNNARVKFKTYDLDLKKSYYTADSATYYNSKVLRDGMLGHFRDEASTWSKKKGNHPQFESYSKKSILKSNNPNFRYVGGIKVRGYNLLIGGSAENKAKMQFLKDDQVFFQSEALEMGFNYSTNAAIKIFIANGDSITHPSCRYYITDGGFAVARTKSGVGNNLFRISYSKMETNMKSMYWISGSNKIHFGYSMEINKNMEDSIEFEQLFIKNLIKPDKIVFRSYRYFDPIEFKKLQMYETRNPLFDIRNYCLKNNTRDFTVAQFSEYLRKSPTTVKNRLIGLWYKGFLTYSEELQSVHVKQKLFNHVAYYLQTEDYDIIQIESPDRKFIKAEYNLKNNTLILDSIERVILSNLKRTAIKPAGKRVVVKKDRNMELKGTLQSGRAVFFKGTYKFNYKDFLIKIDSAEKLFYHEPAPVYSKIEHIKNSTVLIDSTNNRSGINGRETRHYPIYKSPEKSFVYYDSSTKHSKNDFYFEVYPHTVPDLRRISGTSLFLKGKMTTGSVLPPFEDTLSIQYDTELITDKNGRKKKVPVASLGFLHELGNDSVPLFGKGALKKNAEGKSLVRLSRAGLRGEGQIEWLTSVMQADSFNFHPNSLTADAANFRISESIDDEKYPVLKAEDVEIEWDAENETIVCNTKKEGQKIYIYEGKISMEGTTTYTPDYLSGSGIAEYKNTQVTSDSIVFTENSFYADNSTFVSFEPGSNKEVKEIEIYHMKSYTDMKADKTAFEATDSAYVDIESNQFYTYPKFMTWDHKSRTADINRALNHHTNSDYSVDPVLMDSTYMVDVVKFSPGSIYGSTDSLLMRSKKDSLQFYGTDALFESKLKNLTIKKIKRIDVADISIIPSSDLVIKADGKINKLKSTRLEVLSDSNVVVHEITNVDINIKSKDKYNASSGTYKYRDITGKDQNVYFKTIIYDEMKGATVANGHISEKRNFTLSPYYYFKGDVEFNAKKDLLDFDGFAKMKPFCNYNTDWFFFKDEINPKKVIIPLNKDLRSDSTKLRANVYADIKQAKDSFSIVPVFFKTAPGTQQGSIYSARNADYGTRYDVGKNQYIVAPLADLMQGNSPTDYITYNTKHCVIETKGKLNYANIQNVKFIAGGSSLYDLKSKRFRMESFTILDFHFDKSLMTLIAETVNAQQPSQPISVDDKLTGIMKLAVGEDIQQQYLSNLSTNKILPSPLNNRFVFSQLKFYWEEEVGAFKSSGKVGILSIDGTHINEYATVKMQVTKAYGYDEVKLYIKANDEWFYFRFFGSQLYVYSSNAIFNKTVEDTGFGKRKDPDSKLRYLTTNKGGVQSFLESF